MRLRNGKIFAVRFKEIKFQANWIAIDIPKKD